MRYDRRSAIPLVIQALAMARGAHAIVLAANEADAEYVPDWDRVEHMLGGAVADLDSALSSLSNRKAVANYREPESKQE